MNDTRKKPLLTIRPYFDVPQATVHALVATALSVPVITVAGGGMLYILLSIIGLGRFIAAGYIFGLLFIAALVIVPPLFFEQRKRAYQRTAFHFYDTHVDYQYFQFHVSQRRGRLKYRDIDDISQRSGTLQEQRRLVTVYLYANSMRYAGNGFPGLKLEDLRQSQDYMTHIMHVIEGTYTPPAPPVMAAQQAQV